MWKNSNLTVALSKGGGAEKEKKLSSLTAPLNNYIKRTHLLLGHSLTGFMFFIAEVLIHGIYTYK